MRLHAGIFHQQIVGYSRRDVGSLPEDQDWVMYGTHYKEIVADFRVEAWGGAIYLREFWSIQAKVEAGYRGRCTDSSMKAEVNHFCS